MFNGNYPQQNIQRVSPFTKVQQDNPQNPAVDNLIHQNEQMAATNTQLSQQNQQLYSDNNLLMDQNNQLLYQNEKLRRTISQLKAEHSSGEWYFSKDCRGVHLYISGKRCTPIGFLKILSISVLYIQKNKTAEAYYDVKYFTDKVCHAVFKYEELSSDSLCRKFTEFRYNSKCSKSIVNNLIRMLISDVEITDIRYVPDLPGFFISEDNVRFYSGNDFPEMYIRKFIPENVLKYSLKTSYKPSSECIAEINQMPPDSCTILLIAIRFSGLISSILNEIGIPFQQIVNFTGTGTNIDKAVMSLLQVYNRPELSAIPLNSGIKELKKALNTSKDCVVCFNDITAVNNESRREGAIEVLMNDLSDNAQHIIAVISDSAPYLIPNERLLCISAPVTGYVSIDRLKSISTAMEKMDSFMIKVICDNFTDFKKYIKEQVALSESNIPEGVDGYSKSTYCLIMAAAAFFQKLGTTISLNEFKQYLTDVILESSSYSTETSTGIVNDFSSQLNAAIKYGVIEIIEYGKDMGYSRNSGIVIHKDNMLIFEEEVFTEIILPEMKFTQNLLHVLKALDAENFLIKKKKNRYPLTVYDENGTSVRMDFIAVYYKELLDPEVSAMIEGNHCSEFFHDSFKDSEFLPLISSSDGKTAGKLIKYKEEENLHISVTGQSGCGKTVFLSQLLCSMKHLGDKVIVFDCNDSFTYETLCKNLSAEFVDNNITFHSIEEEGIPVDIFNLDYCSKMPDKKKLISGVLAAPIDNLSQNQHVTLKKYVAECIRDEFDFDELLTKLKKGDKTDYSLYSKLCSVHNDMEEYGISDSTWEKFIDSSRSIIVISMSNDFSNTGNQLIDMLIASLYNYQLRNTDRQLDIFIDEIQNQNLLAASPIAKIMKEGRKYHIALIFATQISSKGKSTSDKIMKQAGTSVFFKPDSGSRNAVADMLNLSKNEVYKLDELQKGECIVSGHLYSSKSGGNIPGMVKGKTYLHFNSFDNI